jgi:uncharacterized OB-fold protein
METKERYVNRFYTNLAENKLVGQKCEDCGTYRLFSMPVCENCQGTRLSWIELSNDGKLLFFSIPYIPPARFAEYGPYAFGSIQLKEGPVFWTLVEGIDLQNPEKDFSRLPLDVDILIKELAGNCVPIAKVR